MNDKLNPETTGSVLVVGGGIGGMQSALDLADSGYKVYLVDSAPSIGGTMAALDKTFPTNDCAMCVMSPKLVECSRHLNIEIITWSDVEAIEGEPGRFKVHVANHPRYVDMDKCTGCGECMEACPVRNVPHFDDVGMESPQLSEGEQETADRILKQYPQGESAMVSILQDINETYRYLPETTLQYVSLKLQVPLSHIYNLATFYSAFSLTPRGKHTIQVCMGTACHVKGAPQIMASLERELGIPAGGTTKNGLFSLEAVRCLGCCGLAPVITVGEDVYGEVTQSALPGILKNYSNEVEQTHAETVA